MTKKKRTKMTNYDDEFEAWPKFPKPFPEITEVHVDGVQVFPTKDSGERIACDSGMVRDVSSDKPRFDLLLPKGVPYEGQLLTRFARLLQRGAEKYAPRNWEQAATEEEYERFRESAFRHLIQWLTGETDEDHAAAVMFNLMGAELVKGRLFGNTK